MNQPEKFVSSCTSSSISHRETINRHTREIERMVQKLSCTQFSHVDSQCCILKKAVVSSINQIWQRRKITHHMLNTLAHEKKTLPTL
jgi:hypothetical protein